jgi:hypothetical protein
MAEGDRGRGWLPPQAPGGQPAAADAGGQPSGERPAAEPPAQGASGQPPPPTGAHPPPPRQPPPTYAAPPYPAGAYVAPPGPIEPEPGNGEAIAGLVLGICSVVFVVFSLGFSSIISLVCGVLGIIFGRKGKRNVDDGATRRHRGLAQAGFVTGIVGSALSVIATAVWVILFIVADDFEQDFDGDFQQGVDQSSAVVVLTRLGTVLARATLG